MLSTAAAERSVGFVADPRRGVASAGTLKSPLRIQPEQTVVAGAVQVDEHRRQRWRNKTPIVRARCRVRRCGLNTRHVPGSRSSAPARACQGGERRSSPITVSVSYGQRPVDADQIDVRIPQVAGSAAQSAALPEVEKQRAAAEKWLVVGAKIEAGTKRRKSRSSWRLPPAHLRNGRTRRLSSHCRGHGHSRRECYRCFSAMCAKTASWLTARFLSYTACCDRTCGARAPRMATILIVDDHRVTRLGLAEMLADAGYTVVTTGNFPGGPAHPAGRAARSADCRRRLGSFNGLQLVISGQQRFRRSSSPGTPIRCSKPRPGGAAPNTW